MPRLRGITTLALGLSFLLLAGCSSAPVEAGDDSQGDADDASNQIAMKNMAFSPKSMTVHVGESVTWVNQDSTGHTVSADDPDQWGTPGSGDNSADWMMKGDSWSHTFTEPGTYHYYCKPHASGSMGNRVGMVGTIIVEA
ncbi:MAG: plastocyanin/azurin family copper-binding protein [Candidatus Thermoplasmatota archaeon]